MKFLEGLLGVMALLSLVCLLLGLPLMLLWNNLLPELFNFPTISFWQAVGLNFLASILFGKTSSNPSSK
jgi:hypothetical protein